MEKAPKPSEALTLDLPSNPELIEPTWKKVEALLAEKRWPEEERARLELALSEGLANAMKHGNKMDPSKNIGLSAEADEHELRITITDEGEGFDAGRVPDPLAEENLLENHGRGIFLLKGIMDTVEHRDGGRTLVMTKKRQP